MYMWKLLYVVCYNMCQYMIIIIVLKNYIICWFLCKPYIIGTLRHGIGLTQKIIFAPQLPLVSLLNS